MDAALGIYVHIPFCASKCPYCDFHSVAAAEDTAKDAYLAALLTHIGEYAAVLGRKTVDTVYFGGGTPTAFGDKRLVRVLREIKKHAKMAPGAEVTVEANPESAALKTLKRLKRAGFNRLSLGFQSADDDELKTLGRAHTAAQAAEAFEAAKKAGFRNISLDLMYGLPGQKPGAIARSVDKLIALKPSHVSCYALKLEPETPMGRENPALMADDDVADGYLDLCKRLEAAGYSQYEISNFALPGMESRHNSKYWTMDEYLGFGASAHSYFSDRRFAFMSDHARYAACIKNGLPVVSELEDVDGADRSGEYLMLSLRTTAGIDARHFSLKYRRDFAPMRAQFERYVSLGLAAPTESGFRLTPNGFFVSNTLITELLDVLDKTPVLKPGEAGGGYVRPEHRKAPPQSAAVGR